MKDNRFIELVNLYIDRQISAAEAADLEAEMQANPRRRAIYQQYCRMHRATTLVYESFRADAPEQQTGLAKGRATIARFQNKPAANRARWAYYAGGLAAAACLAILFVRLNTATAPVTDLAATTPKVSHPTTVVASLPPAPVAKPQASPAARTMLTSLPANNLAAEQNYSALLAALRQEEQRAFANGQIQANRLPSLFEDGVFETQQGFPATSQRVFRSKQAPAQQAEFTAFQFQR